MSNDHLLAQYFDSSRNIGILIAKLDEEATNLTNSWQSLTKDELPESSLDDHRNLLLLRITSLEVTIRLLRNHLNNIRKDKDVN